MPSPVDNPLLPQLSPPPHGVWEREHDALFRHLAGQPGAPRLVPSRRLRAPVTIYFTDGSRQQYHLTDDEYDSLLGAIASGQPLWLRGEARGGELDGTTPDHIAYSELVLTIPHIVRLTRYVSHALSPSEPVSLDGEVAP
jgi:hypothetical protein